MSQYDDATQEFLIYEEGREYYEDDDIIYSGNDSRIEIDFSSSDDIDSFRELTMVEFINFYYDCMEPDEFCEYTYKLNYDINKVKAHLKKIYAGKASGHEPSVDELKKIMIALGFDNECKNWE